MAQVANTQTLLLFPRQMRFVKSAAPFPAYIGGIGSGKSFAGGAKVIARLGRKELGMIAAPTYQMLRDSTLRGFLQQLEELGIPYTQHKSENVIAFQSGHEILCRSLEDPAKVRGPNLDYAWVDEGGYITAEAWSVVKGRVRVGVLPQAWNTSTPKGRNWMWEEWERDATGNEFDPTHPLYRVRTDENPELPTGFGQSLGYAGHFAEQELGGEFVAFDGLVYPGFQRSKQVHVVDTEGWASIVCLDVGTRNPTALLTLRHSGDRIHVEREFYQRGMSSDSITDAAVAAFETEPRPDFLVIDPSAAGLIMSLANRNLSIRKGVNDVLIGISRVTTALSDLTVDPSCVNTISEFESYQYPDGKRGNSDNPIKENDHCLIAGTMIETETGPKAIDVVQNGERVWTRDGLKPVLASGLTNPDVKVYTVHTSDDRTITGSSKHPVWTDNRGWVFMDSLRYGDILSVWKASQNQSYSMASHSGGIPIRGSGHSGSISLRTLVIDAMAWVGCTRKSGSRFTDRYQAVTRFITPILTQPTMNQTTSFVSPLPSINRFTDSVLRNVREHLSIVPTWMQSAISRKPGMVLMPVANGTVNMARTYGQSESRSLQGVINAESRSNRLPVVALIDSAPTRASRHGDGQAEQMTKIASVFSAAKRIGRIGTADPKRALVFVVGVTSLPRRQAVYNLTVADKPEFYANGILVHNSMDALRYGIMELVSGHSGPWVLN